jgi:hypothetical protein
MFWYFTIYTMMHKYAEDQTDYLPPIKQFCKNLASRLQMKFDWENETVIVLGTLLDPRFKNLQVLHLHVREKMWDMFRQHYREFVSQFPVLASISSSFSCSSSSSSSTFIPSDVKALSGLGTLGEAMEKVGFSATDSNPPKSEFDRYRDLPTPSVDTDPLEWWSHNSSTYPTLSKMAKHYLAIPASSAASERAWSSLGDIFTRKRNRLKPMTICKLLWIKHNQDVIEALGDVPTA